VTLWLLTGAHHHEMPYDPQGYAIPLCLVTRFIQSFMNLRYLQAGMYSNLFQSVSAQHRPPLCPSCHKALPRPCKKKNTHTIRVWGSKSNTMCHIHTNVEWSAFFLTPYCTVSFGRMPGNASLMLRLRLYHPRTIPKKVWREGSVSH
jgi:hypothetical protein